MAPQDHEQDDRSGHNISSKSCHRCKQCDAHYYWCHLDDTQKYFFKCMVGDFQEKMVIPRKFVEHFKGQISEVVKLEAPDGNIYSVHAIKDLNKIVLGSRWKSFASFYELKEGYFLVFRYTGDSHFKVLIFDNASCCEKEVFHVVMNCGPTAQEEGTHHLDRSPPSERRSQNGGSSNGESRRRCEQCDVHYYWHHLDDTQKYFLRFMVGNFRQEMSIPEKFVNNFRGQISGVIKVEAPDGNAYSIEVTKDLNRIVLGSGWEAFADAYELKEHDVMVFRYIGDSHFKTVIFDPSGCEKELFHVSMNRAPNVRETGILHDRPVPKETRCQQSESCDNNNRKRKKKTPLPSPSLRSGFTPSANRFRPKDNVRFTRFTTLEGLTKTKVYEKVEAIKSGIPIFVSIMLKTNIHDSSTCILSFSLDYARDHLPAESKTMRLYRPGVSTPWKATYRNLDNKCSLVGDWRRFTAENKLRVGDICLFERMESRKKLRMMVHIIRKEEYC